MFRVVRVTGANVAPPGGSSAVRWACVCFALCAIAGCGEGIVGPTHGNSDRADDASSEGAVHTGAAGWDGRGDAPGQGGSDVGTLADAAAGDANINPGADGASAGDGALAGWNLTWRDEFDGAAGTSADNAKWRLKVGPNGANGELEYYTSRPQNVTLDGNGNLVITALKESYMGYGYTSARLESGGRFQQAYGRFESRIKLPAGQGIWPAFWGLGNNIGQVGWPSCGEIDIMENIGREPSINHGSLHGPGYSGNGSLSGSYRLPDGAAFASDFHVFAVEWEPNVVRFYVDQVLYETRTPADLQSGQRWVFDHPFTIIVNVAVGGGFPGNPNSTTQFPQQMLVDYVRVYAR